jgi:hypothetical protein
MNSAVLIRSEQQKLRDSVIELQLRTLVAAGIVCRSGGEADRSGAFPAVPKARMSLEPDCKCAFLTLASQ